MRFWIAVSRGDASEPDNRLARTTADDRIAFYSPRPRQCFTAIAQIGGGEKREVHSLERGEAAVQPLLESLDFIRDKKSWGVFFRRGFFEISEADFQRIKEALAVP